MAVAILVPNMVVAVFLVWLAVDAMRSRQPADELASVEIKCNEELGVAC